MAQAQIIGGTYHTSHFLWNTGSTVYVGALRGVGGSSLEGKVASVQIVSEAQKKSFLKATATGLAGAALAGPVGAVAGVVAGGNRKEVFFACRTHAGSEFTAKGDSRIFELLLAESMKPRREAAAPLAPLSRCRVESSDFPPGCELILKNGVVKLYHDSPPPVILSGKVTHLEREAMLAPANSPSEIRFLCRLRDGRAFVAQGDAVIYETLQGQQFRSGQNISAWIFGFVLFLVVGLAFYFQAPITEFVSPTR